MKLELEKETKVGSVAVYPRLDYFAQICIDGAEVCFLLPFRNKTDLSLMFTIGLTIKKRVFHFGNLSGFSNFVNFRAGPCGRKIVRSC